MTDHKESRKKIAQVLEELRSDYLEKFPKKLVQIRSLIAEKDWRRLEDEFHKLKGTGKTYGFPEISKICQLLEAQTQNAESLDSAYLQKSADLLERLFVAYTQNVPFDLHSDSWASEILKVETEKS